MYAVTYILHLDFVLESATVVFHMFNKEMLSWVIFSGPAKFQMDGKVS
jgi:hypothetical protein